MGDRKRGLMGQKDISEKILIDYNDVKEVLKN